MRGEEQCTSGTRKTFLCGAPASRFRQGAASIDSLCSDLQIAHSNSDNASALDSTQGMWQLAGFEDRGDGIGSNVEVAWDSLLPRPKLASIVVQD